MNVTTGDGRLRKLNPSKSDRAIFQEVLGVDLQLAYRLEDFFQQDDKSINLQSIEGITDSVLKMLADNFEFLLVSAKHATSV